VHNERRQSKDEPVEQIGAGPQASELATHIIKASAAGENLVIGLVGSQQILDEL
jgi:hypothetical protein